MVVFGPLVYISSKSWSWYAREFTTVFTMGYSSVILAQPLSSLIDVLRAEEYKYSDV